MADGIWRTVGGRRVFIADGQDLQSAMQASGKFEKGGWDYRNMNAYLDKVEKEIDELKDPFSKKAVQIHQTLDEQLKIAARLREEIKSGQENGDIRALARVHTRIKNLQNKLINGGIRHATGR